MEKISPSEITPEHLYLSRRKFMVGLGALVASTLIFSACRSQDFLPVPPGPDGSEPPQAGTDELGDEFTPYESIINYNNC